MPLNGEYFFCVTDWTGQFEFTLTAVSVGSISIEWICLGILIWTIFMVKENIER